MLVVVVGGGDKKGMWVQEERAACWWDGPTFEGGSEVFAQTVCLPPFST